MLTVGITARIELNCRRPRCWWTIGVGMHTSGHVTCYLETETSNPNPPHHVDSEVIGFG